MKISFSHIQVEGYLTEGTLVEDYVLDNVSRLMGCIRDCNSTLRWVMLHTATGKGRHCSVGTFGYLVTWSVGVSTIKVDVHGQVAVPIYIHGIVLIC